MVFSHVMYEGTASNNPDPNQDRFTGNAGDNNIPHDVELLSDMPLAVGADLTPPVSPQSVDPNITERARELFDDKALEYFTALFGALLHRTGDPHVAEDLAQETLEQALIHIGNFDARAMKNGAPFDKAFEGWIFAIARNRERLNARYERGHMAASLEHLEKVIESSKDFVQELIQHHDLNQLIQQTPLTNDQKLVLQLRYIEGRRTADIAALMGKDQTTIRVTVFRAMALLRETVAKLHSE